METHKLLTGETMSLSKLNVEERTFLRRLAKDAKGGADYFDLLRRVKGPKALPLRGGPITPAIAASVLYRAAHDIADRTGIEEGYLLALDVARSVEANSTGDLLSLTEAADFIGITRPAAHQALTEKRLRGRRVGNAWVVATVDAEAFRRARSTRADDAKGGGPAPVEIRGQGVQGG
jgi:hypothetical protein